MHRSRHLTLTSSLWACQRSRRPVSGEFVGRAAGAGTPPTRRGPTASRARDDRRLRGSPGKLRAGYIRPPWKPTANPSNARIAVEPFTERKQLALLVSASIPADRHS